MTTANETPTVGSHTSLTDSTVEDLSETASTPLLREHERMSPPRTVVLQPAPAPYAQLCFDPTEDTLLTVMISSLRPSRYRCLLDDAFDLPLAASQSVASQSSSSDWLSEGSSSSSSSSSSDDSSLFDSSPQEIVWMDEAWLFDTDHGYDSLHLLHDMRSSDVDEEEEDTGGCGKLLLHTVTMCKPKVLRDGNKGSALSKMSLSPKRLFPTKDFGYSVLHG